MMRRRSVIVLVRAAAVLAACLGIDRLAVVPLRSNLVLREVEQRTITARMVDTRRAAVLARMNLDQLQRTAAGGRLDPFGGWILDRPRPPRGGDEREHQRTGETHSVAQHHNIGLG